MKSFHRIILHYTTSNGSKREYAVRMHIQDDRSISFWDHDIPPRSFVLIKPVLQGLLKCHYMDADYRAVYLHVLGIEYVRDDLFGHCIKIYHRKSELLN